MTTDGALGQEERERIVRETIAFVFGHYEVGPIPFDLRPVDIDQWWSKRTLNPHDPDKLFPESRQHFEARKARWIELATAHVVGGAGRG